MTWTSSSLIFMRALGFEAQDFELMLRRRFLGPAVADAEIDAAAGHPVEAGELVGEQDRMCASAARNIAVPKRTRWVRAPTAASVVSASMRGRAVKLSPTQTE